MEGMAELKKELGFASVFCIATGAMISSGLFVLPGIAFGVAGPGVFLCYLVAAVLVVPALLSKAELATAMPRAGGDYLYIDRSLGPAFGTLGGVAAWASLSFKSAFALIGMSAFTRLVWPGLFSDFELKLIAAGLVVVFALINLWGAKHVGRIQIAIVFILLAILGVYVVAGLGAVERGRFSPMLPHGWNSLLAGAGMVFVAFGGLTKIASVAEEVKDPSRTVVRAMFASYAVVSVLYVLVVLVTVGLVSGAGLSGSLTPTSLGGAALWPGVGKVVMTLAALMAFVTTANAGVLAASRFPMAMSRDGLLPAFFGKVSARRGTPHYAIIFTCLFMMAVILFLDITLFVKTASAMMVLLFLFTVICVILMRESRMSTYRPKFRSPLYPWLHVAGIVGYTLLLVELGTAPLVISAAVLGGGFVWYSVYAKARVLRESALVHLARRIASRSFPDHDLEEELADMAHEPGEEIEDRFDRLIEECTIFDLAEPVSRDELFRMVSAEIARDIEMPADEVRRLLDEREEASSTVLRPGLAVPHVVVEGTGRFDVVVARSRDGVGFTPDKPPVKAMFFLVGSSDERNFHLRALMAIAEIVQNVDFDSKWFRARGPEGLRKMLLAAKRRRGG